MKQYIVDAFTDKPFSGNPAAVCAMDNKEVEFNTLSGEATLVAVSEIVVVL